MPEPQRGIGRDRSLTVNDPSDSIHSPEFWLNLQKLYELRLARDEIGEPVQKLPKLTERKRSKARQAA